MNIDENEIRTISYFDNKAILEQKGPYGHWFLRLERGVTPKEFSGAFTNPGAAIEIVKSHEQLKKNTKG